MHTQSVETWRHSHVFLGASHSRNERRTWAVVAITAAMMLAEIVAGWAFGSMALLADGFHMATHAGALSLSALAYLFARRHAENPLFSFGTGKLGELAAFASAVILVVIAVFITGESLARLAAPVAISFESAMAVAAIGLVVNLACAWILGADHGHGHAHHHGHAHDHGQAHDHGHTHRHDTVHEHPKGAHRHAERSEDGAQTLNARHDDYNLRAAYLHVLTDALTSVLAIAALAAGWALDWIWLDPVIGIVGSLVIAHWSWGLMKGAGAVLLDTVPDEGLAEEIRNRLEREGDRIADLHLWRVGPGHVAAIVSLASERPQPPAHYKARLSGLSSLSHVTVEVNGFPHRAEAA